jgi:hypothetical protein
MTERTPDPTPERRDDDRRDDDRRPDWDRDPNERPPFDRDPDAQRAPGPGESDTGGHRPPMQAEASATYAAARPDENVFDAPGIAREHVGNDNIREGKVGGVMGGPHQAMGQGQGG